MGAPIALEYLAGLTDGEGCVSISYDRPGSKRSPRFVGQYTIGMTALELIQELHVQFEGSLHGIALRKDYYKPMLYWSLTARAASSLLQKILPYLHVKRRQAELLIELHERKTRTGRRRLTREEIDARFAIWKECRDLNGYNHTKRLMDIPSESLRYAPNPTSVAT